MPIPAQNDFLLPFLQILSDGNRVTRGQMLFRLGKHFNLSQSELNDMTGNQFTVINRLAWCDAHFVKAGFVDKRQHHADSMEDEFSIASLGMRELQKHPEKITVGYLQGFYRGKVHRGAGSDDTTSDAELLLYERFEKLADPFVIFHSVRWITHDSRNFGSIGEADFIIAHPAHGVLVLEVKGGEISIEAGQWLSRDQRGMLHEIKDPCAQAERNRWALVDWLANSFSTRQHRFAVFAAVALPDSRVAVDVRPDCVEDMFIDMHHLDDLEARLLAIFAFWKRRADSRNQQMDGRAAVNALTDLLVPTRTLQPRVAEIFERERRKIDELTQTQFRILRQLRMHRRAAIIGGAGTGKTMLAMEKAQQLADAGFRVLLVCFNKHLADWIEGNLQHPNILVSTYHALVGRSRHWAGLSGTGPRMEWDEFRVRAPEILMDAVNIIRAPGSNAMDKLFDAIIVDEAQDFEDTWWITLPDLLKDPETGVFYVFFDDNQRIFTQISNIPMDTEPFYLDENCRNTRHIHAALLPYARVDNETIANGPEGRPVQIIPASDKNSTRRELQRVLHQLVNEEGIPAEDIVILTPASEKRSQWRNDDQLGNFIITWNLDTEMSMAARVCTIYSYKGLESAVVILTELDLAREDIRDQLIYVGLSRARHHVVVVGELPPALP
ncbi:MAG: AAA family ATPase [Anaerolineae bacterium]|nr:AAA family ATPase [Anaerolineae bacterium]